MSTFKEGFIKYGQDHGYIKPKKKSDSCEIQLRDQCKHIADGITNPVISNDEQEDGSVEQHGGAHEWMEGVYDIQWITNQDHKYQGARLLVAGGGPNIWVNMNTHEVEGYWWGDHCKVPFVDNLGLDEYLEELHSGSK